MSTATAIRPETITLETLRGGAAIDLFDEKLAEALANIQDDRTDGKKARRVVLTVVLQPWVDEEDKTWVDRNRVAVNVLAEAKLVAIQSGEAAHRVEKSSDGFQLAIAL